MATFEGSYLGDRQRLPANARLECKICWWVYDPAEGDAQWQIPAGVPFADLPSHWRCPQCDGDADQFMVVDPPPEAAKAAPPQGGAASGPAEPDPRRPLGLD